MERTEYSLLSFPCQFTFKIIGKANSTFEGEVMRIMHQHFPGLGEGAISLNLSKNGKYLAFSIVVPAENKAQLDATYEDLSSSPEVLFAL